MGHRLDLLAFCLLAASAILWVTRAAKEPSPLVEIERAVNNSQWQQASELLKQEVVAGRGPELDFKIRQIASNLHHQADNLVRLLDRDYAMGHHAKVTPAIQWAQNSTHVFINIKYSHRWNSPGALHVTDPSLAVSSCCFNFSATGEHSGVVKQYMLSFELAHDVVPCREDDQSWWTQSSVGRMTVTLEKAEGNLKWRRLVADPKRQPSLGHVGRWLDLEERYAQEMSALPYQNDTDRPKPASSTPAPSRQLQGGRSDRAWVKMARFARARLIPKFLRVYLPKSKDSPAVVLAAAGAFWAVMMATVVVEWAWMAFEVIRENLGPFTTSAGRVRCSSPEITEIPVEGGLGPSSPATVVEPSLQRPTEECASSTASTSSTVDVSDTHYNHEVQVLTNALVALIAWPITFVCVFLPSPVSSVVRGSTRPLVYRTTAVARASARVFARTLRTVSTKESRVVVILFAELWLRICALLTTKEMHELGDTLYRLALAIIQVLRTRNIEDLLESVKDLTGTVGVLWMQLGTSTDVKKIIDEQKSEKELPAQPVDTVSAPSDQPETEPANAED
ncbi:hypothetical protein FOL46_009441, partial [Perkinsus olseni]